MSVYWPGMEQGAPKPKMDPSDGSLANPVSIDWSKAGAYDGDFAQGPTVKPGLDQPPDWYKAPGAIGGTMGNAPSGNQNGLLQQLLQRMMANKGGGSMGGAFGAQPISGAVGGLGGAVRGAGGILKRFGFF